MNNQHKMPIDSHFNWKAVLDLIDQETNVDELVNARNQLIRCRDTGSKLNGIDLTQNNAPFFGGRILITDGIDGVCDLIKAFGRRIAKLDPTIELKDTFRPDKPESWWHRLIRRLRH